MNYNWDEQFLKRQADSELDNIQTVFKKQNIQQNKNYSILDIGCSNGYNTMLTFKKFTCSKILGIDIDNERILNAVLNNHYDNFSFKRIDILKVDINEFIKKYGKFDIIYCSYVIQYIKNPQLFLLQCRKLLKKNGVIFIKASDDNGKISYPHSEILNEVIQLYSKYIAPSAERFCASKCYSWLQTCGYRDIVYHYFIQDTVNKSIDEKLALYDNDFLFRKFNMNKHYKYSLSFQRYEYLLSTLHEMFQEDNFYYSSISYIITAYY